MKSVFVTVMLFLLPVSVLAGKWTETFEDTDLEEWQELIRLNFDIGNEEVSWEITNRALHAIVPLGITRLLTIGNDKWRDYVIEFEVKPLKEHGSRSIAIAARVKDTWAVWCMIGDGPQIGFEAGSRASCLGGNFQIAGQTKVLASIPSPFLKLNKWSTLRLKVEGDVLTFWINGKDILGPIVLEFENNVPPLLTGKVGLGLAGYTARFDNMSVAGNTVLDTGGFAVEPKMKLATTWGKLKLP